MDTELPVIAVDGTAASGKGTLARRLAAHLGYAYFDTGTLYRCVAVLLARRGWSAEDAAAAETIALDMRDNLDLAELSSPLLRTAEAGRNASVVAAYPAVRGALVDLQRNFAAAPPALPDGIAAKGAVLDGRDIGTVICPRAAHKFYVDADIEVRARRRFAELQQGGYGGSYDSVLEDMKIRDKRDGSRNDAPMKAAEDAVIIDTTSCGPDEVFRQALIALNSPL